MTGNDNELIELAEKLKTQKKNRYDVVVPGKDLHVTYDVGTKQIFMDVPQPGDKPSKQHNITDWAHHQISEKTGIPMRYYRKMQEKGKLDLLATNINEWLPSKEKRLVRVLNNNVRALLSDRYRCIDNYDIFYATLDQFNKIQEKKQFVIDVQSARLTDTNMYIKATSPQLDAEIKHYKGHGEPVHGGIIITNSEVGNGAFTVKPFINVLVCSNGLVSDQIFKRVHMGRSHDIGYVEWSDKTKELEDSTLWAKINDMIWNTFDLDIFAKWVDELNDTASKEIQKPEEAIDHVIKKYEIPKSRKESLLNQFTREGSPTQWGLSMAITRVAQDEDNYNEQVKMEEIGAKLLKPEATIQES
jgi:hypothetical protein